MSVWEYSALRRRENILERFYFWKCHRDIRAFQNKADSTRDVRQVFTDVHIEWGSPIPLLKTISRTKTRKTASRSQKKKNIMFHAKMQRLNPVLHKITNHIWFGTLEESYSLRRPLMPLHASRFQAAYDFQTWNFRTISRGVDLLLFWKKIFLRSCCIHHDLQWALLPSPLTMLVLSKPERTSLR